MPSTAIRSRRRSLASPPRAAPEPRTLDMLPSARVVKSTWAPPGRSCRSCGSCTLSAPSGALLAERSVQLCLARVLELAVQAQVAHVRQAATDLGSGGNARGDQII